MKLFAFILAALVYLSIQKLDLEYYNQLLRDAKVYFPQKDGVLILTSETIDEALKLYPKLAVLMYAPWCPHCKALYPEIVEALKNDEMKKMGVVFGRVDIEYNSKIRDDYKVYGMPTVLYFENEKQQIYRILRAYKNRFGPTSEIGIFEMKADGLREVENPSLIFLSENSNTVAGNVVTSSIEGTRPLLIEIQSLVARTNFGLPRRMVSGYDLNRVIIIIAVLEKRIGIPLDNQDVFINVVGGIKIKETASDLAIACAIASANSGVVCPDKTIIFGEVGLAGEVRAVSQIRERLTEAEKLGFKKAIIPKSNLKSLNYKGKIEIIGVTNVHSAIQAIR